MREFLVPEDFHPDITGYKELVRCKDCKYGYGIPDSIFIQCTRQFNSDQRHKDIWFCADGERVVKYR